MSGLAQWFAGIDSPPVSPSPAAQENRHASPVAVVVSGDTEADPLVLVYCVEEGPELLGRRVHARQLPMRCAACRCLQAGRCIELAGVPGHDEAALCRAFSPAHGVQIGRCWLYRIELASRRLVWLGNVPAASQTEAIAWARKVYGEEVQAVTPIPGAKGLPAV